MFPQLSSNSCWYCRIVRYFDDGSFPPPPPPPSSPSPHLNTDWFCIWCNLCGGMPFPSSDHLLILHIIWSGMAPPFPSFPLSPSSIHPYEKHDYEIIPAVGYFPTLLQPTHWYCIWNLEFCEMFSYPATVYAMTWNGIIYVKVHCPTPLQLTLQHTS